MYKYTQKNMNKYTQKNMYKYTQKNVSSCNIFIKCMMNLKEKKHTKRPFFMLKTKSLDEDYQKEIPIFPKHHKLETVCLKL